MKIEFERNKKWILIIRMSEYDEYRKPITDFLDKCSFYYLSNDVFISDTADATEAYTCAFYIEKMYSNYVSSIIPIYGEVNSDVIGTKGV